MLHTPSYYVLLPSVQAPAVTNCAASIGREHSQPLEPSSARAHAQRAQNVSGACMGDDFFGLIVCGGFFKLNVHEGFLELNVHLTFLISI